MHDSNRDFEPWSVSRQIIHVYRSPYGQYPTVSRQKPDRLFLNRIRTDRQRTAFFLKIWTESGQRTESRQTKSGQTDTRQEIRTESEQQTDALHVTLGHGQCRAPTSALNQAIHQINMEQTL